MARPATAESDVLVVFGVTGDLAKKMTFRSLYRLERRRLMDCPIVGVAHDECLPPHCESTPARPSRTAPR
jgi:glucose-6-phosphate 1-dehydrogenase